MAPEVPVIAAHGEQLDGGVQQVRPGATGGTHFDGQQARHGLVVGVQDAVGQCAY